MRKPQYAIFGSGGGGRMAYSVLLDMIGGKPHEAFFFDDGVARKEYADVPVPTHLTHGSFRGWLYGNCKDLEKRYADGWKVPVVVALGCCHMGARARIFHRLETAGAAFWNAVHPIASVSRLARMGRGNVLCATSVLHATARIGDNCFLCVGASVDHDSRLGDNVYLGPGARLCGEVQVGKNAFIGTGAVIFPRVTVGDDAVVGAGALVRHDVCASAMVYGVPATEREDTVCDSRNRRSRRGSR